MRLRKPTTATVPIRCAALATRTSAALLAAAVVGAAGAGAGLMLNVAPAFAATSGSGFYIRGGGFGHDIGMSQYGAAGFAQHGYSYEQILHHYYSQTTLGSVNPSRTVTVLLSDGAASFRGATTIKGSSTKLKPSTDYGVLLAGTKVELISHGRVVGKFAAPLTVSGKGPLDLLGEGRYRGSLVFSSDGQGTIQTVNSLGLDNYVRGVVAAEMPASWPAQALDAQAVAARTYAITSGVVARSFMLYDDTRSQVYRGVDAETPATNAAVKATAGEVVEYDKAPATTYFFASSGGHTKSIQFSWGVSPEAWLVGVPDPYDDSFDNPYFRWKLNLGVGTAAQKLGAYLRGRLKGITITSGNARIVGTAGTTTVDGYDLEGAFGTLSPNMTFTTIKDSSAAVSATPNSGSSSPSNGGSGVPAVANAKSAKVTVVDGVVFPVNKNALVTAQLEVKGKWRTVGSEHLPASGKFAIPVASPGRYRVLYNGVDGPAITVK